jgi:hypothetical protein
VEAWAPLDRAATDTAWEQFGTRFRFRPSARSSDWPAILEPRPYTTYSIAKPFVAARDRGDFVAMGMQLNLALLSAFRRSVAPGDSLQVLDWQHACYAFYPHTEFQASDPSAWRIQPFPDGDYYIFLGRNISFGTFGHPWEQTICVFGEALLHAFNPEAVPWLGPVVRQAETAA